MRVADGDRERVGRSLIADGLAHWIDKSVRRNSETILLTKLLRALLKGSTTRRTAPLSSANNNT